MISLHRDKRSVYIMLYNAHTTLDCQTIHNTIFESIQENKAYQESDTSTDTQTHITLDEIQTYKFYVYLDSILLTGGTESNKPYHECFFGELDSKDNNIGLDISKPIYHFIPKDSSDFIESKQNMQRDSAYKQDSTFAESSSDSNKLNADSTQTAKSTKDSTTSTQTDSANDSIISPQSPQQDSKLLGTLKYI